jgi:hypothetical protein
LDQNRSASKSDGKSLVAAQTREKIIRQGKSRWEKGKGNAAHASRGLLVAREATSLRGFAATWPRPSREPVRGQRILLRVIRPKLLVFLPGHAAALASWRGGPLGQTSPCAGHDILRAHNAKGCANGQERLDALREPQIEVWCLRGAAGDENGLSLISAVSKPRCTTHAQQASLFRRPILLEDMADNLDQASLIDACD